MNAIRVLITDDHLIVREGLRLILETAEGIEVVGEARDGGECLRLVAELAPDVVLMDLQMPGMDGITAIGYLRREVPAVAIVILTTFNEDALMLQGLQAGARGYLLKDTDRATLLDTIQAAARGETLLRPEILSRVLAAQAKPPAPDPAPAVTPLSDRELEVLRAAARGERNKEIARALGISERTVKAHLAGVFNKLGVDSRAAAVAVAAQQGWLEGE
ncbi:MAG: response regulator transcription factor [Caldilinea sp.]|nr:response regulator transcription factor [Caldilinea sp.]MCB0146296.1 response regulator transcription factor [Caldilineaceae bacterium]MCB9114014.1 response regulator transcription factor [Caldilineaceae bacterium]MCB9118497.1 response regulator transcription factor [Caldilineaceae bacterium]MCO5212071.1 response regulator transcription factor [Caldilinea sp.]